MSTSNEEQQVFLSNDQLEEILNILTSPAPNKEEMNKAYALIKSFSKSITCIPVYLHHIKTNQKQGQRQLSAVLLSKRINKLWGLLSKEDKFSLSKELINTISNETSYLVSKAIGLSISKLIIHSLKENTQIESEERTLLEFILSDPQSYSSNQSRLFEINLYILSELLEECDSSQLLNYLNTIKKIISVGIQNGTSKMKENSTICIGNVIKSFENSQISDLINCIPSLFNSIESFSEETISHIYETICDFSIASLGFFGDSIEGIIEITFKLLLSDSIQVQTKMILAEFIQMTVECNKKLYTNNNKALLVKGVSIGFKLSCMNEDEEEFDDLSLFDIGNRVLGIFSLVIKSGIYYPIVMEYISKILNNNQSKKNEIRSAISAIGVIADGCQTKYRDNLDDIVNILVNSFNNHSSIVIQKAAIVSLDSITEIFNDRMGDYHDKILPMLYKGLTISSSEKIIEACLIELNYFIRTLDFEIDDYIDKFTPLLANIILNSPIYKLKSEALFALSSFISRQEDDTSIKKNFDYKGIINTCHHILTSQLNRTENELKGHALRCIAEIAVKVKLSNEDIGVYNKIAVEFINNKDEYCLVESGFGYLGLVSTIINLDSDLNNLINIAFDIIKDTSGVVSNDKADEYGFDSDSEVEEGHVNNGNNIVNEDFINAKCATILAVTQFFESQAKRFVINNEGFNTNDLLNSTFLRYLETLINIFEELWDNIDDNINYEMIIAYKSLVVSVFKVDPQLGRAFWVQTVFFKYEEFIKETEDKGVVVNILESIYSIINELGKDTFLNGQLQETNILERILNLTKQIINNKLACQIKNNEDDDEEDDFEEKLLQAGTDIYLILSEKLGDEFHNGFSLVTDTLNKLFSNKRSEYDKALGFAVYAEVLKYCKVSVKFYCEFLFKQIENCINKLSVNIDDCYRNISYLIGILYQSDSNNVFLTTKADESLKILNIIYENSDSYGKENSISAICRIFISLKVDLTSDLFEKISNSIFSVIPLVNDHIENETIIRFLYFYVSEVVNSPCPKESLYNIIRKYIYNIIELSRYVVVHEKKCDISSECIGLLKTSLSLIEEKVYPEFKNIIIKKIDEFNPVDKEIFIRKLLS